MAWPQRLDRLYSQNPSATKIYCAIHCRNRADVAVPFQDVLVFRNGTSLATKFIANPSRLTNIPSSNLITHHMWNEVYFKVFTKDLPPYAKKAKISVIKLVATDLIFSFTVHKVLLTRLSTPRAAVVEAESKRTGLPYVKSVSEEFKCIYNIRLFIRTKHTSRSSLMKTTAGTTQCVSGISCECGRSCIGGTGRSLVMWLGEHRHNHEEGFLKKIRSS